MLQRSVRNLLFQDVFLMPVGPNKVADICSCSRQEKEREAGGGNSHHTVPVLIFHFREQSPKSMPSTHRTRNVL
jgi:hypothetical protein